MRRTPDLAEITLGVFAVLFVIVAVERLWIDVAIVGVIGGAYGLFLLWASRTMRGVEKFLADLPEDLGEPSKAMLAVDALDDAIHSASGVPFTDQVRLDRGTLEALLGRLRAAVPWESPSMIALIDELDELVGKAKSIPLTSEIRLDRAEVDDILDRVRASFAEGLLTRRAARGWATFAPT